MVQVVTASLLLSLLVLGGLENLAHARRLSRIPLRILVNGSRGKSAVTRLVAAALRESGRTVVARTTGTEARHILPDGSEVPVVRKGRARIIELVRTAKLAASLGADALVVECMAILPEYQSIVESRLVRPTHGIITNAREDHLDVMGPGVSDVAVALCAAVPWRGTVVTAERTFLPTIEAAAKHRGARLVAVQDDEVAEAGLDCPGLSAFAENTAVAMALALELGIPRELALCGMRKAAPDPGELRIYRVPTAAGMVVAVNAFSANDPESTGMILRKIIDRGCLSGGLVLLYNHRTDRAARSLSFCPLFIRCYEDYGMSRLVLVGRGTLPIARRLSRMGMPAGVVERRASVEQAAPFMDSLASAASGAAAVEAAVGTGRGAPSAEAVATIVGIGNSHGQAERLVDHWKRDGAEYA